MLLSTCFRSFNSKDYPTLYHCDIHLQEFPEKLRRYDWDCSEILDEDGDDDFRPDVVNGGYDQFGNIIK